MKNDIKLFIQDKEIEFSADPRILLSYRLTELHNPTVLRNSFSKQITVPGTNRNNDVFGHIWELSRIQDENFNPSKKVDFQLFVNDELFQKGYVKLDNISRTYNTTEYKITLYGGLGSFFYNLTYDQDDSGNVKKTLASLSYAVDGLEPDLDFVIDRDNVMSAWTQINQGAVSSDRWNVINFCPALNGIPNDFDASKVLINFNGLNSGGGSGFQNGVTIDGVTYRPTINGNLNQDGWSLGEHQEDLQEWQTRDLRSYNQRPCINMRRIIQACGLPENNGGYQLKLDSHFFHDDNPYYNSAWITLPLLKDLDGTGGETVYNITGATWSDPTEQYDAKLYRASFNSPAASLNNVRMSVSVRFNPDSATSVQALYPYHEYHSPGTTIQGSTYVRDAEWNSGVVIQLFALGQNGNVMGQSKAYLLGGEKNYFKKGDPMWNNFWNPELYDGDMGAQPEYEFVDGYFKRIGGNYVFCNSLGQKTNINFSFIAPSDFVNIVMKVKTPLGEYVKYGFSGTKSYQIPSASFGRCYTSKVTNTTGNHTYAQALQDGRVLGGYSFVIDSFDGVATDYEGLFSGTRITKERLLSGKNSPGDYLISYCKLFGLYFYYDSTEDADDPSRYPLGVVHIMDRDTFYTDEVQDLSKAIDWNKKVEVVPALAATKYYRFDVEHVDSQLEAGYEEQYGKTYGSQLVNTNYNFDAEVKDLYDGNVFKAGIMALEKDKYYKKSPVGLPVYQYNGFKYNLYYRGATDNEFQVTELEFPVTTTMHMQSVNPYYEFYDQFPKLEFHTEDNTPSDGSDVLVFYKGYVGAEADYFITDDINEMITLNDAEPCWIMTKSEYDAAGVKIANKVNQFPCFTRDLVIAGDYGNIIHSWNFGHPQVIYSPDTYTTEGDSIYDKCWKNYIRDMYDVNTRKLTCYVKAQMDEHPWPYWLRRFYWFENSIWRLNEIKDLNPASFETTKMEFVKVQDMENYKLDRIEYDGSNHVDIEGTVPCTGGSIQGIVVMQGSNWASTDYIQGVDGEGNQTLIDASTAMIPHTGSTGSTSFTVTVPANTADTQMTWTVTVKDTNDARYSTTFVQETCNTASTLSLNPAAVTGYSPASAFNITVEYERVSGITYSCSADWVTLVPTATGVAVQHTRNAGNVSRSATIVATGTGTEGPISATATFVQLSPGEISVSTNNVVLDWNAADTKYFGITTHDDWTSEINDN